MSTVSFHIGAWCLACLLVACDAPDPDVAATARSARIRVATSGADAVAVADAVIDADADADAAPDAVPDADADADAVPDADADAVPDADTDTPAPPPTGPARYAPGQFQSPITAWVAQNLRDIAATSPNLADDVFMKVGASGTVSTNFLTCFAGSSVDWTLAPDDDGALVDTRDHFLAGDAAGTDPFSRVTLAAKVGKSAGWAISGDPSPMAEETAALQPRFALIAYGTNDMQLGTTFQSAMWGFGDNLQTLVDTLIDDGIVPILQTNGPRLDNATADRFVETYNTIIRGIAQARQIPLLDMWSVMSEVPGWGKAGDGLHLNASPQGACVFTDEGLDYGYNARNLNTLHALHRAKLAVVDAVETLDPPTAGMAGDGSPQAPFVVDALPFTDGNDTSASPYSDIDIYEACSTSNQSGPEVYYTLTVDALTRVRIMVHDQFDTDVDIHLLDQTGTPQGCIARAHRLIETTLSAGTYTIVVDSWVDASGTAHAGSYLLGIVECHPDDPSCD